MNELSLMDLILDESDRLSAGRTQNTHRRSEKGRRDGRVCPNLEALYRRWPVALCLFRPSLSRRNPSLKHPFPPPPECAIALVHFYITIQYNSRVVHGPTHIWRYLSCYGWALSTQYSIVGIYAIRYSLSIFTDSLTRFVWFNPCAAAVTTRTRDNNIVG
jgi:hypothetical protein